jgi:phage host-nuclease inhibitor protein Gam
MTTTVEAARERVNLALREVGRLQLRLQELTTDMDREVDRARSAYAARIQTAQEKLSAAEAALGAYASEHRAELLPGSKIKSFHLLFGTIAWRYDPPRVELARGVDADAAAQRLRDLGHDNLVRIRIEPNKPLIRDGLVCGDVPERDIRAAGLRIVPGAERFSCEPDLTEITKADA